MHLITIRKQNLYFLLLGNSPSHSRLFDPDPLLPLVNATVYQLRTVRFTLQRNCYVNAFYYNSNKLSFIAENQTQFS